MNTSAMKHPACRTRSHGPSLSKNPLDIIVVIGWLCLALLLSANTAIANDSNASPPNGGVADPAPQAVLKGSGGTVAQFSADGKVLLTAGGASARLWDAKTFRALGEPMRHPAQIKVAALSGDGARVLTAGADGSAVAWDARTGKALCTVRQGSAIGAAAIDRNGSRIITAGERGKTAAVWDVGKGKLLYSLQMDEPPVTVQFSPAGDRIMVADGSGLSVFDALSGKPIVPPKEFDLRNLDRAVYSHDGTKIAATGWDFGRVFDAASLKQIAVAQVKEHDDIDSTWSVAISPDGRKFATGATEVVRLWDAATGKPLTPPLASDKNSLEYYVRVMFSADGRYLFGAGYDPTERNFWEIRDAESGKRLRHVRFGRGAQDAAISSDGEWVAAGGAESGDTAIWKTIP